MRSTCHTYPYTGDVLYPLIISSVFTNSTIHQRRHFSFQFYVLFRRAKNFISSHLSNRPHGGAFNACHCHTLPTPIQLGSNFYVVNRVYRQWKMVEFIYLFISIWKGVCVFQFSRTPMAIMCFFLRPVYFVTASFANIMMFFWRFQWSGVTKKIQRVNFPSVDGYIYWILYTHWYLWI